MTTPTVEKLQQFVNLTDQAIVIRDNDTADWTMKYDLVFSPEIAGAIETLGMLPEYVDPDADYEDDVRAFVDALERDRAKVVPLLKQLQGPRP